LVTRDWPDLITVKVRRANFDESAGDAYVGDTGGVRIPPAGATVAPTPPPDIDLEAWRRAFDVKPGDRLYLKPEDRLQLW